VYLSQVRVRQDLPLDIQDHRIDDLSLLGRVGPASLSQELDQFEQGIIIVAEDGVQRLLRQVGSSEKPAALKFLVQDLPLVPEQVPHDPQNDEGDEGEDSAGQDKRQRRTKLVPPAHRGPARSTTRSISRMPS